MQRLDQNQIIFSNNNNSNIKQQEQKNIKIRLTCRGGNLIYQFCSDNNCKQKNNFFCQDNQCKCNQNHENCIKLNLEPIIRKMNEKIIKNKNLFAAFKDQISQIFTNLINKISEDEERILKEVENHYSFINLMDLQRKFYSLFVEQKIQYFQQFDGQKLSNLLKIVQQDKQNNKQIQQLIIKCCQMIIEFQRLSKQTILKNQKYYSEVISCFKQKIISEQFLIRIDKLKQVVYPNFLFSCTLPSKIIVNQTQLNNLINFFNKKVKSINLKFRASQNDFDMKKYYQKCGNLQNTIVLVQTDKNKIIGGYTPLTFNPIIHRTYEFVSDQTGTSFLFSLTNNNKFQLKQKQKAIRRISDKQCISFGSDCTLVISNKANHNEDSYFFLFYKTYVNQNYLPSKQSYLKLIGNQIPNFKIKQWEVLQVQFQ